MTTKSFSAETVDRLDFPFFEHVLARQIARPTTAKEAHVMIQDLLVEAISTRPYDLLQVAATAKIEGFLRSNPSRNREATIREVAGRLWIDNHDGHFSPEVNPRANAVTTYDASKCGVIPYLRIKVGFMLSHIAREQASRPDHASLEVLSEKVEDLDDDGQFVRGSSSVGCDCGDFRDGFDDKVEETFVVISRRSDKAWLGGRKAWREYLSGARRDAGLASNLAAGREGCRVARLNSVKLNSETYIQKTVKVLFPAGDWITVGRNWQCIRDAVLAASGSFVEVTRDAKPTPVLKVTLRTRKGSYVANIMRLLRSSRQPLRAADIAAVLQIPANYTAEQHSKTIGVLLGEYIKYPGYWYRVAPGFYSANPNSKPSAEALATVRREASAAASARNLARAAQRASLLAARSEDQFRRVTHQKTEIRRYIG